MSDKLIGFASQEDANRVFRGIRTIEQMTQSDDAPFYFDGVNTAPKVIVRVLPKYSGAGSTESPMFGPNERTCLVELLFTVYNSSVGLQYVAAITNEVPNQMLGVVAGTKTTAELKVGDVVEGYMQGADEREIPIVLLFPPKRWFPKRPTTGCTLVWYTAYQHLNDSVLVTKGQILSPGDQIGTLCVYEESGAHSHFSLGDGSDMSFNLDTMSVVGQTIDLSGMLPALPTSGTRAPDTAPLYDPPYFADELAIIASYFGFWLPSTVGVQQVFGSPAHTGGEYYAVDIAPIDTSDPQSYAGTPVYVAVNPAASDLSRLESRVIDIHKINDSVHTCVIVKHTYCIPSETAPYLPPYIGNTAYEPTGATPELEILTDVQVHNPYLKYIDPELGAPEGTLPTIVFEGVKVETGIAELSGTIPDLVRRFIFVNMSVKGPSEGDALAGEPKTVTVKPLLPPAYPIELTVVTDVCAILERDGDGVITGVKLKRTFQDITFISNSPTLSEPYEECIDVCTDCTDCLATCPDCSSGVGFPTLSLANSGTTLIETSASPIPDSGRYNFRSVRRMCMAQGATYDISLTDFTFLGAGTSTPGVGRLAQIRSYVIYSNTCLDTFDYSTAYESAVSENFQSDIRNGSNEPVPSVPINLSTPVVVEGVTRPDCTLAFLVVDCTWDSDGDGSDPAFMSFNATVTLV
jgi:hypothetical protein